MQSQITYQNSIINMSRPKIQSSIEKAISKADSTYFFEDYQKQAVAVLKAIDAAGYILVPKDPGQEVFVQAAAEMRTGRLKPDDHVKDVYHTLLRIIGIR